MTQDCSGNVLQKIEKNTLIFGILQVATCNRLFYTHRQTQTHTDRHRQTQTLVSEVGLWSFHTVLSYYA